MSSGGRRVGTVGLDTAELEPVTYGGRMYVACLHCIFRLVLGQVPAQVAECVPFWVDCGCSIWMQL